MEALRTYNLEVSGAVDVGRARRRWGRVGHARGRQRVRECGRERGGAGRRVYEALLGGESGCAPREQVCRGGAPLPSEGSLRPQGPPGNPGPARVHLCSLSLWVSAEFPELHV